jgi:hypothetical protein
MDRKAARPSEITYIYGIPEGALANMRAQRIGPPYFKVGRKVFYFLSDIEKWIKSKPIKTNLTSNEDEF